MSAKFPMDAVPVRDRVAHYERRSREAGLVRVAVWVPDDRKLEVHELAKALRAESGKKLPND